MKKKTKYVIICIVILFVLGVSVNENKELLLRLKNQISAYSITSLNSLKTTSGDIIIKDFYQNDETGMYIKLENNDIKRYDFLKNKVEDTNYNFLFEAEIIPYQIIFSESEVINAHSEVFKKGANIIEFDSNKQNIQILHENSILTFENNYSTFTYQISGDKTVMVVKQGDIYSVFNLEKNEEIYQSYNALEVSFNGKYIEDLIDNSLYKWDGEMYKQIILNSDKQYGNYDFYDNYIFASTKSRYDLIDMGYVDIYVGVDFVSTKYGNIIGGYKNHCFIQTPAIYGNGHIIESFNMETKESKYFHYTDGTDEFSAVEAQYITHLAYDVYNQRLYLSYFNSNIYIFEKVSILE